MPTQGPLVQDAVADESYHQQMAAGLGRHPAPTYLGFHGGRQQQGQIWGEKGRVTTGTHGPTLGITLAITS